MESLLPDGPTLMYSRRSAVGSFEQDIVLLISNNGTTYGSHGDSIGHPDLRLCRVRLDRPLR